MPKVSIIIPTYNREKMLKEAIDSVFSQTFKDFELIIVDDGSTDGTGFLLNTYKHKIRVIKQQNKGVSSSRNRGVLSASGEFIAFLDSDDLWLPEKISRQMDFFNCNENALICQTEEIWIRNGIQINPKKRHQKLSGFIFEESLELCLVSPSAVMIRKDLFEDIGLFDENLPACEDYDLWLRIGYKYPIYLIKDPLIIKRGGHEDQLSRSTGLDKFRIMALMKIIEKRCLNQTQLAAAEKKLKEKCFIYSKGCLNRGRIEEASYYLSLPEKLAGCSK